MTPMRMSDEGLRLITDSEGLQLEAYPDPGTGGEPWTIGYGHTDRGRIYKGMTCTKEQALEWLRSDIAWAERAVLKLVKVPIDQSQFDALVDFVFNTGEPNFTKSTLLKKLNAGLYSEVDDELKKWVFAAGKKLAGLVTRRNKEADMFDDQAPDQA